MSVFNLMDLHRLWHLFIYVTARGNQKKARKRLRGGYTPKNHHFSTFRSGAFIGAAIPAFIEGFISGQCSIVPIHLQILWSFAEPMNIQTVFQPHTQEAIPHWDVLLFFYGVLFIPVLFSLLVGFNLLVWANSRINYAFIFGMCQNPWFTTSILRQRSTMIRT